ncbi:MAG: hypothetical protein ACO1OB_32430, partial [Archangium sp.]
PKGETGDPGAMGATGAEGAQGVPGPVGPAGMVLVLDGGVVTGPPGAPVIVTQLNAGSACPTGGVRVTQLIDGGVVDVCNGAAGPSPSVSTLPAGSACATGGLLIGLPDGGSMPLCNGAVGPQGPQGVAGPTGATGGVGPAGPVGPQGMQGVPGPTGATGAVGPAGPAGPQGAQGVAGPQGSAPTVSVLATMSQQCPTGGLLIGLPDGGALPLCNGATGAVGATGGAGPAGPQGIQGVAGPTGATGGVGPAGPTGATGGVGPAGPAGPAGPTGAMGPQGPMGPAGSVLYVDGGVVVATSAPVQFVGFTQAVFTGDLGGLPGAAAKCRAEFTADSFLCTIADYDSANTTAVPPTGAGSWVDYNRSENGSRSTSACTQGVSPWTNAATPYSASGAVIGATGYIGQYSCAQSKHLACCRGARGNFRGFTTATFTGDLGGIPGANAKCRVDFPNSWLCTVAEYDLSNTATVPPSSANAWIDYNRSATGNGTRSTSACTQNVSPWTNAATPYSASGAVIGATGYIGQYSCAQSKHLACCGGL